MKEATEKTAVDLNAKSASDGVDFWGNTTINYSDGALQFSYRTDDESEDAYFNHAYEAFDPYGKASSCQESEGFPLWSLDGCLLPRDDGVCVIAGERLRWMRFVGSLVLRQQTVFEGRDTNGKTNEQKMPIMRKGNLRSVGLLPVLPSEDGGFV